MNPAELPEDENQGRLHTVRQVAQKRRLIYKESKREYCLLDTDLGPVLQMEVGPLLGGEYTITVREHLVRGQRRAALVWAAQSILVPHPACTIRFGSGYPDLTQTLE